MALNSKARMISPLSVNYRSRRVCKDERKGGCISLIAWRCFVMLRCVRAVVTCIIRGFAGRFVISLVLGMYRSLLVVAVLIVPEISVLSKSLYGGISVLQSLLRRNLEALY